jgi:hypothetical protein
MAENKSQQENPGATSNTFSKGMLKDYNDTFVGEGLYTHARNAVNNSHDGQVGVIGNEPSNLACVTIPYSFIGCIHLLDDQWLIFSTDDVNSAVGIFDESLCTYTPLKNKNGKEINFTCLGLKRSNLITGLFRKRYDCERLVYWDDGLNPTRMMDIDTVPCIQSCTTVNSCTTCVDTEFADCEKIRVAPLIQHPCITISKGQVSGTLPNGSYQACIAYTVNQVKMTDYIGLTDVQGLFTHENTSSSLEINIQNIDKTYDEFELVIITSINAQSVAKRIGYYNTSQGTIYVDRWDTEYVSVNVGDVVFRSEPIEKTDAMYSVNNYGLRVGVYSKFKFNYQPQANNIVSKWNSVEYPADYYVKGNNKTGYLRDEVYAFFIRFIYNTGEFSESYHIPGRASLSGEQNNVTGGDAFETMGPNAILREYWQVQNTASIDSFPNTVLPDGGIVRATGSMAYWQSTEQYPSNRFDIWGNLCGKKIRHHKMPDETIGTSLNTFANNGNIINLLGVQFENITAPLDNNGNPINSIVGYEILRGSREGNKSIIAKGLINNMREYDVPGNTTTKGLLQNYPYNDLSDDVYLTKNGSISENGEHGVVTVNETNSPKLNIIAKDIFTFHSPDVTFSNPYLNANELKVYQLMYGNSFGSFENSYKHPKFKTLTDAAGILATAIAVAIEVLQIVLATAGARNLDFAIEGFGDLPIRSRLQGDQISQISEWAVAVGTGTTIPGGDLAIAANNAVIKGLNIAAAVLFGVISVPIRAEQLTKIITALAPKIQNSLQYNSHGFYNNSIINISGNRRREIIQANYVGSSVQQFTTDRQVNNINRSKVVILKTNDIIANPPLIYADNSRFLYSQSPVQILSATVKRNISSYYAALKISIPSQYGQLDSIKQLPVSTCINKITPDKNLKFNTSTLFGGDIYINRFTEKNTMPFFTDWLMGEPDLYEYDYTRNINIPYPRFWINNTEKHSIFKLSNDYRALDSLVQADIKLFIIQGYFYLFNSGVRDFFCESEVNVAYRDWEEDAARRHYDPYNFTDLNAMFRSDIIRSGNYYKYDYNLSIAKLFNSHISWGNLLPRDYNPITDATCYTYRPNRVIYSLPQQDNSKKDNWRIYLNNNYKDFSSPVTAIKQVNKTGALFMMKWQSPLQFMGVEELKLEATGAKITIGDAGLFTGPQQLQSIVNADESYEYGSCQGKYCSINTIHGVFWISQNQGKVFQYGGQISEISNSGLKWWFAKYLPSELLKVYSTYAYYDNPVIGVGVQMIYDNTYEIIYITKKDYKAKFADITLGADNKTFYKNGVVVELTDERYFEKANFTISYDPKSKAWISFHDWIPTFLIPGRNHFMSVARDAKSSRSQDVIWKHNLRCDSYCNYYNVDYPFEIEFVSATGQTVNTVRSIEYLLEVYKYHNDCRDKFHVLDENFDQAIIYNSEQISGILKLNLKNKNNPLDMLAYPKINLNPGYIDIQYSKEENKYRFNQFWDITKNRGEYIPVNIPMFVTAANGYIYPINPNYVNYDKGPLERKKFRHNVNRVFLKRFISGDKKFLFKISNQKLLQSLR